MYCYFEGNTFCCFQNLHQFVETMKQKLHETFSGRSSGYHTPRPSMVTGSAYPRPGQSPMKHPPRQGLYGPQAGLPSSSTFSGHRNTPAVGSGLNLGTPGLSRRRQDLHSTPAYQTCAPGLVSSVAPKLTDGRQSTVQPAPYKGVQTPLDRMSPVPSATTVTPKDGQTSVFLQEKEQNITTNTSMCEENTAPTVQASHLSANPKVSKQTDLHQVEHKQMVNPLTPDRKSVV